MSIAPIPQEFINELLIRCDIVQLIDARVPLRKKGKNYIACCPFHTEKTPSFTVTPEKQFYYCFGCAAGGNAISFLMEYEGLNFVAAVSLLAEQCGFDLSQGRDYLQCPQTSSSLYALLEKVVQFYEQQLRLHPYAIDYLKQRGISGNMAKQFSLGYAPVGWDSLLKAFKEVENLFAAGLLIKKSEGIGFYDRFRDRIIFPIRDKRGRVIGFGGRALTGSNEPKYLNSPETALFHKSKELYGLYETCQTQRQIDRIIVVEGYIDVLALFQVGLPCGVATLGTAVSRDQILRLLSVAQKIIFCFDGDAAGKKAAWRALEMSLSLLEDGYSIHFLLLPEGEDPDSFIQKQGREGFITYLKHTQSISDFLFDYLLAQVDLSQLEGKARLAKLAIPLIEKVPLGIIQHKLFEQLASLVNMDLATLKQVTLSDKMNQMSTTNRGQKKLFVSNRHSPMRLAITLLVQHPHLMKTLSKEQFSMLSTLALPGNELLVKLALLLKQVPTLTSAMLLEYWRDDEPYYKILKQLIQYPLAIPSSGLQAEFHDLLNHLKRLAAQRKVDKLLQQGKQRDLTVEEKKYLYGLMLNPLNDQ